MSSTIDEMKVEAISTIVTLTESGKINWKKSKGKGITRSMYNVVDDVSALGNFSVYLFEIKRPHLFHFIILEIGEISRAHPEPLKITSP